MYQSSITSVITKKGKKKSLTEGDVVSIIFFLKIKGFGPFGKLLQLTTFFLRKSIVDRFNETINLVAHTYIYIYIFRSNKVTYFNWCIINIISIMILYKSDIALITIYHVNNIYKFNNLCLPNITYDKIYILFL